MRDAFTSGFEYSDCWVDDARMVVLNARDAAARGADIRPRTRCIAVRPAGGLWAITMDNGAEARARVLVNATGPWVSSFLAGAAGRSAPTRIRMVKGSHIVVRRLFAHDRCYMFQNADGRICFAIPYEQDFTLIGTTDEDYTGDPASVTPSPAEETYLLTMVNAYLRTPVSADDIVWRYAGVRPLRDDGLMPAQQATRDYVLEMDGDPPLLSVFGGKITTFRRLAEAALARLRPYFPGLRASWTAGKPLPGGDFPWDGVHALRQRLQARYPFMPPETLQRFVRSYGTLTDDLLGDAAQDADLGAVFGAGLTEREVDFLRRTEWARTAEDILWRRTKLGLRLTPAEAAGLRERMGR